MNGNYRFHTFINNNNLLLGSSITKSGLHRGLNLISSKQLGFRPKLSTTSALTSFADEVLLHMESGELCGAVFLDLTKVKSKNKKLFDRFIRES